MYGTPDLETLWRLHHEICVMIRDTDDALAIHHYQQVDDRVAEMIEKIMTEQHEKYLKEVNERETNAN